MLAANGLMDFSKKSPHPSETNGPRTEWKIEIPVKPKPDGDACEVNCSYPG